MALVSLAVALSCVTYSNAFIASKQMTFPTSASSSALRMSAGTDYVSTLPGAPFPDGKVWDPVGLSDRANPTDIKKWREAEIKHGRVAMLATVGVLVAEVRSVCRRRNTLQQYSTDASTINSTAYPAPPRFHIHMLQAVHWRIPQTGITVPGTCLQSSWRLYLLYSIVPVCASPRNRYYSGHRYYSEKYRYMPA